MNYYGISNKIDMITIGVAFPGGGAGGLNKFYQDYLATYTDLNILNIKQIKASRSYLETIAMLLNSGTLKKYSIKYVLVESTQTKIVTRFSSFIDYKAVLPNSYSCENIFIKVDKRVLNLPTVQFINNGNFKYFTYNLLYHISPNAYISKVYKEKLNSPLFSIGNGDDLLFSKKDIKSISKNTKDNLEKVNDELNTLAELLQTQGIKLIFLPVVSKYNLYRDFIKNKHNYPQDPFFDIMRKLDKNYIFVDTKALLFEELRKGIKDIFYIDDTHWSYKASKIIAKDVKEKIMYSNL